VWPVDRNVDEGPVRETPDRRRGRKPPATQSGGAVYGLGFIGALVWYCQQAEGPGGYGLALLKAVAWPAFLVYEGLKALHGLTAGDGSETH
jgi:hypothetical protein